MGTSGNLSLLAVRARVRGPSLRAIALQGGLFLGVSAALSSAWIAVVCATVGWGWWAGIGLATVTLLGLMTLWISARIAFLLQPGLTAVQRALRGWIATMVVFGAVGVFAADPWWGALAAALVGVALTPAFGALARRAEATRLTSIGLPREMWPLIERLPDRIPPEVGAILDAGLQDWGHLRDLLGFADISALRAYVDVQALETSARRSMMHMLARAPVVSKLVQMAAERPDPAARQAADGAFRRLRSVGDALHEAVAAASQYAASEVQPETQELRARVESLGLLAESLDVDGIDAAETTGGTEAVTSKE